MVPQLRAGVRFVSRVYLCIQARGLTVEWFDKRKSDATLRAAIVATPTLGVLLNIQSTRRSLFGLLPPLGRHWFSLRRETQHEAQLSTQDLGPQHEAQLSTQDLGPTPTCGPISPSEERPLLEGGRRGVALPARRWADVDSELMAPQLLPDDDAAAERVLRALREEDAHVLLVRSAEEECGRS